MDFFLNVLLFVPFGFGVAAKSCKRGGVWRLALLRSLAMGACVSYMVELLQFYVPARDSGWEDVLSNSMGSVIGGILFELFGGALLEKISKWEDAFKGWLSPSRAALMLAAYFAVCFGISARLQSETRLSNWDPRCILAVGNDASGQNPWKGQVFRLQIWNRALSDQVIRRIARQESADEDVSTGLLGSYDFTTAPPYHDKRNYLPPLKWTPEEPKLASTEAPEWDGTSWLSTTIPVENLTNQIKKSNQLTVHIVCAPATDENANGRIFTFSESAANPNFLLRQQGQFLVFRLRNRLADNRAQLAWYVPGVFQPGKVRDIVATYDGSDGFIYLDGNPVAHPYRLSPGVSLMHKFFYIEIGSLEGSTIVYETLIFLPAGLLVGLALWKWPRQKIIGLSMLALGWAFPAVLLEIFLAGMSGRRIWPGNIVLSLIFGIAGMLLINADRHFENPSGVC
jgi:hypothetical protein